MASGELGRPSPNRVGSSCCTPLLVRGNVVPESESATAMPMTSASTRVTAATAAMT
jgi:hypothetical protein